MTEDVGFGLFLLFLTCGIFIGVVLGVTLAWKMGRLGAEGRWPRDWWGK